MTAYRALKQVVMGIESVEKQGTGIRKKSAVRRIFYIWEEEAINPHIWGSTFDGKEE